MSVRVRHALVEMDMSVSGLRREAGVLVTMVAVVVTMLVEVLELLVRVGMLVSIEKRETHAGREEQSRGDLGHAQRVPEEREGQQRPSEWCAGEDGLRARCAELLRRRD